jgi:hypothetical protein
VVSATTGGQLRQSTTRLEIHVLYLMLMELLQVGGPLLMVVVLQFPPCLYELKRLVISVYDRLCPQNVMFPLTMGLYNGIHFLVIGGVFLDNIRECLTMVCRRMPVLSENYAHNIVRVVLRPSLLDHPIPYRMFSIDDGTTIVHNH